VLSWCVGWLGIEAVVQAAPHEMPVQQQQQVCGDLQAGEGTHNGHIVECNLDGGAVLLGCYSMTVLHQHDGGTSARQRHIIMTVTHQHDSDTSA
jgi:hypothetical protein